MNCPSCNQPLDSHWFLGQSAEQMQTWIEDDSVCTLTREEAQLSIDVNRKEVV